MAKVITLTGLRKASLKGCKRVVKAPMRTLEGEELFMCADGTDGDIGAEVITLSGLGQTFPDPSSYITSASSRSAYSGKRKGRPRGSYGPRRGGYVDPKTGTRKIARNPQPAVACRVRDKNGVFWDYNDSPKSKFHGQYRCRCRTASPGGKANTGYVPNKYCEELKLPKDPAVSRRIRDELEAIRTSR